MIPFSRKALGEVPGEKPRLRLLKREPALGFSILRKLRAHSYAFWDLQALWAAWANSSSLILRQPFLSFLHHNARFLPSSEFGLTCYSFICWRRSRDGPEFNVRFETPQNSPHPPIFIPHQFCP